MTLMTTMTITPLLPFLSPGAFSLPTSHIFPAPLECSPWQSFISSLLLWLARVSQGSAFPVAALTPLVPRSRIPPDPAIWFPYGNMLLSLATFGAARQPGPCSETNKLSGVYCISFQAALPTLNLAAFQSNQNPISGRANSTCFISSRAEEAGTILGVWRC